MTDLPSPKVANTTFQSAVGPVIPATPAPQPEKIINSMAVIKMGITPEFIVLQISRMYKCNNPAHDPHQTQEQISIRREEVDELIAKLHLAKIAPIPPHAPAAVAATQTGFRGNTRNLPPEVLKSVQEQIKRQGAKPQHFPVQPMPTSSPEPEQSPSPPPVGQAEPEKGAASGTASIPPPAS
jgi:hypothetical protein